MGTFVDTHTHLYLDDFAPENEAAVRRAINRGVTQMIFPNVDLTTIAPMNVLHSAFPNNTFMAMGFHPTEVRETWENDLVVIEQELRNSPGKYVAVGEIGIDLYWDKTFRKEQESAFLRQAYLAKELDLPIIIHCRDGMDVIIDILKSMANPPRGVFHCFSGTEHNIEKIRLIGDYYFGIGGVVTFKKSELKNLLPIIGINRILLETDSPYLAPAPHRGKRNESAYIPDIASFIAHETGLSIEEISEITTRSAHTLFHLGHGVI